MANQLEQNNGELVAADGVATAEGPPAGSHSQAVGDPAANGAVQDRPKQDAPREDAPRHDALRHDALRQKSPRSGAGQPSGLPTSADPTTTLHVGHLPATSDFQGLEGVPPPSTNGVGDARQIRLVAG
jgi:hypothetical protein